MAIEFLQAQKKQRYLILILTLVICAVLLVVWQGFFRGAAPSLPSSDVITTSKIEINWDVLQNPKLEALKAFAETPVFEDKVGRKNPLTPY